MAEKKTAAASKVIEPVELQTGRATFYILGKQPLIYNAISMKVKQDLLHPKGRKTAAEKATTLKHVPREEYRDSVYAFKDDTKFPTHLCLPCRMFKAALAGVGKRIVGSTTAELKQLVWVETQFTPLFGVPQLLISVVRNADINRTPDMRSRAIVPQWCCEITVGHAIPHVSSTSLGRLLAASGILNGVGDWRQEKGSGSYGQFEIVNANDPRYLAIIKTGGKAKQLSALHEPAYYDDETEELMDWYDAQIAKRDTPKSKRKGGDDARVGA